tara:strand:- start:629 stop:796 length:168 start_codon:yes stop_codon:yes gene_type:complete
MSNDTYDKLESIVEEMEHEQGRLYDLAQEIKAEDDRYEKIMVSLRAILNNMDDDN